MSGDLPHEVEDSVILEVSTPELHDVMRIEDRYGRADGAGSDTTEQSR